MYYGLAAWADNNTYSLIGPKIIEQRTIISEFYNRFDYDWTTHAESYEYPQDILYQYFILVAAAGLWHSCPRAQSSHPRFENIGARTLYEWGLSGGAPRARPPVNDWQIVIFPYAWQEFSATALEALLSTTIDSLSIQNFSADQVKFDIDKVKPFWDAILVKGLLSKASCHEILKPALADRLSKDIGTAPFLQPQLESMRDVDLLNEFSLRFCTAHEVGHHLTPIFDPNKAQHPELIADAMACLSLSACNWEDLGGAYAPLIEDATEVPVIAGISFYFILSLWFTTQNVVGVATGEASELQRKRIDELSLRVNSWIRAQATLNNSKVLESGSMGLFQAMLTHVTRFRQYADQRVLEILPTAKRHDDQLIRESPEASTREGLETWLRMNLGTDLPNTLEEALQKLDSGNTT